MRTRSSLRPRLQPRSRSRSRPGPLCYKKRRRKRGVCCLDNLKNNNNNKSDLKVRIDRPLIDTDQNRRIGIADSLPERTSFGVFANLVSDSDEYNWTNKITVLPNSSGKLKEDLDLDLEYIIQHDCESTTSITTTITEIDNMDIVHQKDLGDIFNPKIECPEDEKEANNGDGNGDADLLDANSFVVFGHDYSGSTINNNCQKYSNNDNFDDHDNTNEEVRIHPRGPKTSRFNPMIGERSFTDDIKDGIATIRSEITKTKRMSRRKCRKRKAKLESSRSISRLSSLRGRMKQNIIPANLEIIETRMNNNDTPSPSQVSIQYNNTIDLEVIQNKRPEKSLTRKTELKKIASYNSPAIKYSESIESSSYSVVNEMNPFDVTALSTRSCKREHKSINFKYGYRNQDRNISNEELPRRIAKKFLFRPNSDGECKTKPFLGFAMSKRVKKDDSEGRNKLMWQIVYDDGEEEEFDEVEFLRGVDLYEELIYWDGKFS